MSATVPTPAVVVGTDGSGSATAAVRWAAVTAARHGAPLHILCAIDVPVEYGPGVAFDQVDYDTFRAAAAATVADAREAAVEAAAAIHPLDIETSVLQERPIPAMCDRSKNARMLVVGTHGFGILRRWIIGSVSTALARHAHCPVAVVPQPAEHGPDRSHGPVVVGVDGSAGSVVALDVAFNEASRRGAALVAVLTWSEFDRYVSRADMQQEAEELLARSLAGYAEKYPDVEIHRVVTEDRPAKRILATADHAQLIVVGSHGRGGFAGMTLGSVGHAVMHAAECPVVIARARD